jgi:hypothetical protein
MDNSPHTQHDRNPALLIRARSLGDKEAETDWLRPSAATMRVFFAVLVNVLSKQRADERSCSADSEPRDKFGDT